MERYGWDIQMQVLEEFTPPIAGLCEGVNRKKVIEVD